jgi:hypothetical protein
LPENNAQLIRDAENFKAMGQAAIEQELAADCVLVRFISSSKQGYVCLDASSRAITGFY